MKNPRANNKTVSVPDMARAEIVEWTRATLIAGGSVKPEEISFRGLRAADPISAIRNQYLIPVQRVMKPSEQYQTRNAEGQLVTRSRRPKTDHYRITAAELALFRCDRQKQIQRMSEQRANRRRRDLSARVIAELSRAGEAAELPEQFHAWAAIDVPAPGLGTSAPTINQLNQESPCTQQQ